MELNDFFNLIKRKKQTILSLVAIFFAVGLILTAVQPFKYSSSLRLLVVQSSANQGNVDPYTMARSNEYLSNVLAKVTTSNSFYQRVMNSGFSIDQSYFGTPGRKQNKLWSKTVNAHAVNDTGIIVITAYHQDRQQADNIARAVGNVLMTQHVNYHGLNDNVKIKLLDEPVTSRLPVKPNVALNLVLALVLGVIFSLCYIYLLPDSRYDLRLFGRKRTEEMLEDWLPAATVEANAGMPVVDNNQAVHWPADLNLGDNQDNNYPVPSVKAPDLTSPMIDELSQQELEQFASELFNRPDERPTVDQLYR